MFEAHAVHAIAVSKKKTFRIELSQASRVNTDYCQMRGFRYVNCTLQRDSIPKIKNRKEEDSQC